MPNEKMQEAKSVGPISMLGLCSPLLLLAEVEAEGKAKKARLRAQQVRVAKSKKGRLGATWGAVLRYLRGVQIDTIKYSRSPIDFSRCGPLYRGPFYRTAPARRPSRGRKSGNAVRPVPSQEEKG